MGNGRKQVYVSTARTGLNAAIGLDAGVTSSDIDVSGFSQLMLEISVVRSAATTSAFYIEVSEDSTVWHRLQAVSVSGGTATFTDLVYTKTISASDQYAVNIPLNYKLIRLVFSGTNASATADNVTVQGWLQE